MNMTKQRRRYLLTGIFVLAIHEMAYPVAPDKGTTDGKWRQGYLEGALLSNPHLRQSRIDISFDEDRIRLSGLASSSAARALAEQIALNTPGVGTVENRLTVVPTGEAEGFNLESDAQRLANVPINNKVMARLLSHNTTRGLKITAETRNRIVVVKGEVGSELERELVFWLVKNTDGVKAVVNKLEVAHPHQIQAGL